MQRVLFEHLFFCYFFVLFLKKKASLRIFPSVFETFVGAISKHSHEKIYEPCILIKKRFHQGKFVLIF